MDDVPDDELRGAELAGLALLPARRLFRSEEEDEGFGLEDVEEGGVEEVVSLGSEHVENGDLDESLSLVVELDGLEVPGKRGESVVVLRVV